MKNEYKITKKQIMSWAKEYHLRGASNIISFILMLLLGICGLQLLIFCAIFGGDWINWYMAVLFLFVSIYKLIFSRFVIWSKRYKLLSRTYGVTEWTRTTEFTEDEIILTDYTSISKHRYDNITSIKEKGNVVMIFLNDNIALRLYKDAFIDGTWDDCKELINQKTAYIWF